MNEQLVEESAATCRIAPHEAEVFRRELNHVELRGEIPCLRGSAAELHAVGPLAIDDHVHNESSMLVFKPRSDHRAVFVLLDEGRTSSLTRCDESVAR